MYFDTSDFTTKKVINKKQNTTKKNKKKSDISPKLITEKVTERK